MTKVAKQIRNKLNLPTQLNLLNSLTNMAKGKKITTGVKLPKLKWRTKKIKK